MLFNGRIEDTQGEPFSSSLCPFSYDPTWPRLNCGLLSHSFRMNFHACACYNYYSKDTGDVRRRAGNGYDMVTKI